MSKIKIERQSNEIVCRVVYVHITVYVRGQIEVQKDEQGDAERDSEGSKAV
jgi:hypothetical protein